MSSHRDSEREDKTGKGKGKERERSPSPTSYVDEEFDYDQHDWTQRTTENMRQVFSNYYPDKGSTKEERQWCVQARSGNMTSDPKERDARKAQSYTNAHAVIDLDRQGIDHTDFAYKPSHIAHKRSDKKYVNKPGEMEEPESFRGGSKRAYSDLPYRTRKS